MAAFSPAARPDDWASGPLVADASGGWDALSTDLDEYEPEPEEPDGLIGEKYGSIHGVLSHDPATYIALEEKYPNIRKEKPYNSGAIKTVHGAREDVVKASAWLDLAPEAVAACMLDENSAIKGRAPLDKIQDIHWKRTDFSSLAVMREYVEETPPEDRWRHLTDARTWDVGPYNVHLPTALEVFEQYVIGLGDETNPLREVALQGIPENADEETKWQAFMEKCVLDADGAAYTVAAVLKQEQENLLPYMEGLDAEERAALQVTAFKQGVRNMVQNYEKRRAQGRGPAHMLPGEGLRMLRNISDVHKALELQKTTSAGLKVQ